MSPCPALQQVPAGRHRVRYDHRVLSLREYARSRCLLLQYFFSGIGIVSGLVVEVWRGGLKVNKVVSPPPFIFSRKPNDLSQISANTAVKLPKFPIY